MSAHRGEAGIKHCSLSSCRPSAHRLVYPSGIKLSRECAMANILKGRGRAVPAFTHPYRRTPIGMEPPLSLFGSRCAPRRDQTLRVEKHCDGLDVRGQTRHGTTTMGTRTIRFQKGVLSLIALRSRSCWNTLFGSLASLIAAGAGGSAFAQAVNLTCDGQLHVYEPERISATVSPTASAVDLANNEITTPLGTYRLSRIEENKLTFDGPATRELNLVTHGSLDRLTGKMVIIWLRPEQDAKYKAGQLDKMARLAEFKCSTAKRLF
jgi:hypothetical protein